MKQLYLFPPNYKAINAAFNTRGKPVIYAYGDVIYNPSRIKIPEHLVVHEKVHQAQHGSDPAGWWERYIADPAFRLAQEIPAHVAEYRHFKERIAAGARLADVLHTIAHRLASPLYGSLITQDEAFLLIERRARNSADDGPTPLTP